MYVYQFTGVGVLLVDTSRCSYGVVATLGFMYAYVYAVVLGRSELCSESV